MEKKNEKRTLNKMIMITLSILLIISLTFNICFTRDKYETNYNNDENIIFFGDSITEQYDLFKYYPQKNVINRGISGNKTEDLINRINKDVYVYNPSKIFLLIGINDLLNSVYREDILSNIQTIINGIKVNRKRANLYVESIYPINAEKIRNLNLGYADNTNNKEIRNINKKIRKICEESNVTYIDVYSELVDEDGNLKNLYTIEGLHLNNLGYLKVTSVLEKYINE